jgi:hypothetical protein
VQRIKLNFGDAIRTGSRLTGFVRNWFNTANIPGVEGGPRGGDLEISLACAMGAATFAQVKLDHEQLSGEEFMAFYLPEGDPWAEQKATLKADHSYSDAQVEEWWLSQIGGKWASEGISKFWPEESLVQANCPACVRSTESVMNVIMHLNDEHGWPRERTASWVDCVQRGLPT